MRWLQLEGKCHSLLKCSLCEHLPVIHGAFQLLFVVNVPAVFALVADLLVRVLDFPSSAALGQRGRVNQTRQVSPLMWCFEKS